MTPPWLKLAVARMSQAAKRGRARRAQHGTDARPLRLEVLESRIAPAVSSSFDAGLLLIASDAADAIQVTVTGGAVRVNGNAVGSGVLASAVAKVQITGGPGNNVIDLSQIGGTPLLPSSGGPAFAIDGGGGTDTLVAPVSRANAWNLTGANQGTLDTNITFASVANLTGGAQADTLHYLTAASGVTGALNELGGTLTLDARLPLGSESIAVGGNVNTHGGDLFLLADTSPAPGVTSTITVGAGVTLSTAPDAGGRGGNVTVEANTFTTRGDLLTQGGDLTVTADAITVDTTAGPVTLSTLQTSGPPGTLGNITLGGSNITIGSPTGSNGRASILSRGAIDVKVEQSATFLDDVATVAKLDISSVGIAVNAATIRGGDVTLSADAGHARLYTDLFNLPQQQKVISTAIAKLQTIDLIGGVAVANTDAEITLGAASVVDARSFTTRAIATSEAEAEPSKKALLVAIAAADTKAVVTVAGQITTTGDTVLLSQADNTLRANAAPPPPKPNTPPATSGDPAAAVTALKSRSTVSATPPPPSSSAAT